MQTTLSSLLWSTITGVVAWGFRSSSVAVAHEGYLVESRRPLWFGSPQANRCLIYTEHFPSAAVSSRTLTISLSCLPFLTVFKSLLRWFPQFSLSVLLVLSLEQHAIWKYCIAHKWDMMYIYGIRTYQTYIYIYIYIYIDNFSFSPQVWGSRKCHLNEIPLSASQPFDVFCLITVVSTTVILTL